MLLEAIRQLCLGFSLIIEWNFQFFCGVCVCVCVEYVCYNFLCMFFSRLSDFLSIPNFLGIFVVDGHYVLSNACPASFGMVI